MKKKENWFRILLIILLIPMLGYAAWCGVKIYKLSAERTEIRNDYSEVNNIQYGLLSVDAWRDNVTDIVTAQIDAFKFSDQQQDTLEVEINKVLNSLITQAVGMVNEKQKTIGGKLKKFAFKTFVNVDNIRTRVPEFSKTIINEIKKPQSKERLKFLANSKLTEMTSETCDSVSGTSKRDSIMVQYQASDQVSFNKYVVSKNEILQKEVYDLAYRMLGIMVVFIIIWFAIRNQTALYTPMFILSVLLAIVVLAIGLSSPMIEIDARIKELNFVLIGKSIVFQDQIMFYQSKSILDVVHILIATKKPDSVLVGVLILVFSVVFPGIKLLSAKIYLLGNDKWKSNKFVRFFAFKSGKWSMADVMVIAIFMSYIGFKGILDSQLADVTIKTEKLSSIATNETSLQPGFILFVAFVLFSLLLSVILKRITKNDIGAKLADSKDIAA